MAQVERSKQHAAKAGFQNRRYHSGYLKNSFPSGFQLDNVRNQSSLNDATISTQHETVSKTTVSSLPPRISFTSWTKGDTDNSDCMSTELTDPYAEVAGPYLTDMLQSKRLFKEPALEDKAGNSNLVASEIQLHHRSNKKLPTRPMPQSLGKIYNAPALMPTFAPSLSKSKGISNLDAQRITPYEQWVAAKHSDAAERIWFMKGNLNGFNYSPHDFGGDSALKGLGEGTTIISNSPPKPYAPFTSTTSGSNNSSTTNIASTTSLTVPSALPSLIMMEVYSASQLTRSSRLVEENNCFRRHMSLDLNLIQLKTIMVEEIMIGIEKSFPTASNCNDNRINNNGNNGAYIHSATAVVTNPHSSTISSSPLFDSNSLELVLQCYMPSSSSWRTIVNEVDWIQAKHSCCNDPNNLNSENKIVIKLMYSLSQQSESALLKHVLRNQQYQKIIRKELGAPQISLKALTESLERASQMKKTYVYNNNEQSSNNNNSLVPIGGTKPGVIKNSRKKDRKAAKVDFSSDNRSNSLTSVFYPKRSESLDKIYEQLELSIPKQQQYAENLEQRLLKTRF